MLAPLWLPLCHQLHPILQPRLQPFFGQTGVNQMYFPRFFQSHFIARTALQHLEADCAGKMLLCAEVVGERARAKKDSAICFICSVGTRCDRARKEKTISAAQGTKQYL
jgi:hypothetical protein